MMRSKGRYLCCVFLFVLLSGCDNAAGPGQATQEPVAGDTSTGGEVEAATVLRFGEIEAGSEAVVSRMIVTDTYMRMDSGSDADDFVLLDRTAGAIYSTNAEDSSVLEIHYRDLNTVPPVELAVEWVSREMPDAPRVEGKQPVHHRMLVNGHECLNVVAVAGLLPEAVAAMREYKRVLASEHRRALPQIPMEVHDACDLARNVFFVESIFEFGLPLQEWDDSGYRRMLEGYERGLPMEQGLFELPAGMQHFRLDGE